MFFKWRRFFLFFFISILIFVFGINFYLQSHKDEITQYVIEEINNRFKGSLYFNSSKSSINIHSNFPSVNLTFPDVKLKGIKEEELMQLNTLSIQFSLLDIFSNSIAVKGIELEDGTFTVVKDKQGKFNWDLFEHSDTVSSDFVISLISLKNVYVFYEDYTFSDKPRTNLKLHLDKTIGSIHFSKDSILTDFDSKIELKTFETGNTSYFNNSNWEVEVEMAYSLIDEKINLREGKVDYKSMSWNVFGWIDLSKKEYSKLNISLSEELEKRDVLTLAKGLNIDPSLFHVWQEGRTKVDCEIKGVLARWKNPIITIQGSSEEIDLYNEPIKAKCQNFDYLLEYNNGRIKVESGNLNVHSNLGNIDVDLNYDSYKEIPLWGKYSGSFDLSNLPEEMINEVDSYKGFLNVEKGNFAYDFQNFRYDGVGDIKGLKLKYSSYDISSDYVSIQFKNHKIELQSKDIKLNNQMFSCDLLYSLKDNKLSGSIESNKININRLMSSSDSKVDLSKVMDFSLSIKAKDISYNNLRVDALDLKIKNDKGFIESRYYDAKMMNGRWIGSGKVHQFEKSDLYFKLDGKVANADIHEVFRQMDNFDQNVVTDKHLKGFISSSYQVDFQYTNELDLKTETVKFKGDVELVNGELISFKPMLELSKFIDVKELKHIQFKDVKDAISIEKGIIHFSKMRILSNAFNIELAGSHTFDNIVDYDMRIHVNDILSKKKKLKENVGFDEEGRASLFVKMEGDLADPKVRFNRKAVSKKIQSDFKKQTKSVKNAFKKEFSKKKRYNLTDVEDDQDATEEEFIDWDDNK